MVVVPFAICFNGSRMAAGFGEELEFLVPIISNAEDPARKESGAQDEGGKKRGKAFELATSHSSYTLLYHRCPGLGKQCFQGVSRGPF